MEKYGICTSRHVRRVSLVVTAVDDFTGKIITGSNARIWIDGQKPPIKKTDGWNVFLNLTNGDYIVRAEGGFYNRTSVTCHVTENKLSSIKLRLTPSKNTPLPAGTALIEGKASPESKLLIRPTVRSPINCSPD